MKKLFAVLFTLTIFSSFSYGQMKMGLTVGQNTSWAKYMLNEEDEYKSINNFYGYSLGVIFPSNLDEFSVTEWGVIANIKGYTKDEIVQDYTFRYISIDTPYRFKYRLNKGKIRAFIMLGANLSFLFYADDSNERLFKIIDEVSMVDLAADAGAGLTLFKNIEIGANFEYGLFNLNKLHGSEKLIKNRTLNFYFTYYL
jgi:hypothetical protein